MQKTAVSVSALLTLGGLSVAAQEQKPNILLLLADDLGYGELGCYGQEIIETPNLDRLAAEGVKFNDFHAGNAVSSPSRAVLMTGVPSGYNTIRGNQGFEMEDGATRVPLKKSDVTMAEMLKGAGYQTAFVGKWHLEDPCDLSTWAFSRGFDFAAQEQWGDTGCKGAYKENMEYVNGLQDSLWYDKTKWDCKDEFRTQIAFDYLDNQLDKDNPFFLFMSYRAPHAHEYYINNKELYADRGWPETERMHAAKITLLDKQIGRMIDKLEEMGLMENTMVIFTSDNGPQNEGHDYDFFESNGEYRGYKRDAFEGGHRVPCIIYWKGKIEAGYTSDFLCAGQDLMPTVAEAAGVKAPKQVRGLSLMSEITKQKSPKRDKLYWEFRDSGFSRQAVRMGKWKAARYGVDSNIRLYDLDTDAGETKDVAAEYPEIMARIAPLFENMREDNRYYPRQSENVFARFVSTKARKTTSFDKGWKFSGEDNPSFRDVEYDDAAWRSLNLPHDWSIEEDYFPESKSGGRGGYMHEGIGWYRKTFSVDKSMRNKQHVVQFDGVFMNSEVWINGVFLGRRPYGYSTFQYDITEYLDMKPGAENVIAVRVDNSNAEASRWYNGSGIYRHVHMITTNYTHFNNMDGVYVTTPIAEENRAVVKIDYKAIASYLNQEQLDRARKQKYLKEDEGENCLIRSIIFDEKGIEIARTSEAKFITPYNKYVTHTQEVVIDNPIRWSSENPHMYYLKSEIVRSKQEGTHFTEEVLDDVVTPFGIRKVDYDGQKGLLINDKQVKLNGVCLHHDAASLGAAVPEKVWVYRLQKLREMGCNAIRTSHNPFAPEFYFICDTMGFYVKNEAFDEWKDGWRYNYTENPRGKALSGYQHYFDQWAETDLRDMIHRDRNHPSVIMYGIGNEIPFFKDEKAAQIAKKLVDVCHAEDPTRPVTMGDNAAEYTSVNGVADQLDLLGYNYIRRKHPDSLYLPLRNQFPDKLFLGSETDRDVRYFLAYRDNDYVIGQFIWTGIDYLGESKKTPQRGWQASLLDVTCEPRQEGLLFESCWSDEPKVKIAVAGGEQNVEKYIYEHGVTHIPVLNVNPALTYTRSWNWDKADSVLVNVYSNCEQVELKINGISQGRKDVSGDKYCVTYDVLYSSGRIEAIGYNRGKVVERDELKTSSWASKIESNVIHPTIKADGSDISIIEVQIVDADGRLVTDAENNVAVRVEGSAKFIGMDSGNLFYDGNFKTPNRNAHQGKLLLYIQSTGKVGQAKVTLSSEGLTSNEFVVEAVR